MERAALSWAKNKSAWRFKGPLTLCLVGGWQEGLGGGGDARWGKNNGVSGRVGGGTGKEACITENKLGGEFQQLPVGAKGPGLETRLIGLWCLLLV